MLQVTKIVFMMDCKARACLVSQQPHGQSRGIDDAHILLLQVWDHVSQSLVVQGVMAVRQHCVHSACWYSAPTTKGDQS